MSETLIGIRPGVRFTARDRVRAFHPWGITELGVLAADTVATLKMLRARVLPSTRLAGLGAELGAVAERAPFLFAHHLAWQGAIAVSVTPIARHSEFQPRRPAPGAVLRSSRFACWRRADQDLVMESPLSSERVVLRDPRLGVLVPLLCRPVRMEELRAQVPEELWPLVEAAVGYLLGTGAIDSADEAGMFPEDRDEALRQWTFHDLLFHSRSRSGRHDHPYGSVSSFKGAIEPPPAVKVVDRPAIELEKPAMASTRAARVTLFDAVETRRSIRDYGAQPIRVDQLSEFLYRTARVRARWDVGGHGETTSRPYPAGGARYELELYPIIARCQGLERGAYHYDPVGHRLCALPADDTGVTDLLRDAGDAMARSHGPDVLIAIASRFQRVTFKYGSLAYALTLKNVGALYQTMYLVATAMQLAACALGGGDSDLVGRTLGLDYVREGCVGEFALGSRPEAA